MATVYGVEATKVFNSSIPGLAEQGTNTGNVKIIFDQFNLATAAAVVTSGDVIWMGGKKLPKGARITNAFFDSADLDAQSTAACTVGWLASDDAVEAANLSGLFTTIDLHTAAIASMLNTTVKGAAAGTAEGKFKKFTAPVQLVVKITGTGDAVTGSIYLSVEYVID